MKPYRPPFRGSEYDAHEEQQGEVATEADYLRRLTSEQTPVVIHLRSGEKMQGFIEYYDQRFVRLTRPDAPNLFIFKHDIKYICEA